MTTTPTIPQVGVLGADEIWTTTPSATGPSNQPKVSKNKLLTTQLEIADFEVVQKGIDADEIKHILRKQLFDALVKSNDTIQFTQQYDPLKRQKIFRAYLYVADSQFSDLSKIQRNKPITSEQLYSQWKKYSLNQTLPPSDIMKIAKMVEEFHNIT
jgi:hypothetical protein